MNNHNNRHITKSIRLKTWDYRTPWWYFVTIATKNHKDYFGQIVNGEMKLNRLGVMVNQKWLKIAELRKNVELDYYVIMPNHFHRVIVLNYIIDNSGKLLLQADKFLEEQIELNNTKLFYSKISPKPNSLSSIIRSFKSSVTKSANELNLTEFAWQPRFYDRIIRNEKKLFNIRNYIEQNPLKWKLEKNYPENMPEL